MSETIDVQLEDQLRDKMRLVTDASTLFVVQAFEDNVGYGRFHPQPTFH